VVLLREPASALWPRLGNRILIAGVLALLAFYAPWAWASVVAWVLAGLAALLAALAIANVVKNRRVLLMFTGAGSIEWPQSYQEIVLRRPISWVAAREVVVTHPPVAALPGRTDPRITLTDGTRSIERVPLYGTDPQAFVDAANALLVGRGTTLRFGESEPESP
jgi:hypothetical protein